MKAVLRKLPWIIAAVVVVALLVYAFIPKPVEVDVARADRGAMRVTVDQDGQTRVGERFVVSAPLAGTLRRIPLEEGDRVKAGKTTIAVIEPLPPTLLNVRAREEAEAAVRAAEAALAQAGPAIDRARADLEYAQVEARRLTRMAALDAASREEAEQAALLVTAREADLRSAQFARDVAAFQLDQAGAALLALRSPTTAPSMAAFEVPAPVDGIVLRVLQESTAPVTPGTPLVEIGDVGSLEAVIDVLSRDAVAIEPGDPVLLERWGGDEALHGVVRLVEPSGFTKISALGVEEQRVNVLIDFTDPLEQRASLGDNYRVDARIVVWEQPDVLKLPTGALFRQGERWAVYAIEDGRAVLRPITVGRMNGLEAQVLEGLRDGEQVILHPSDKIADAVAVVEREE